MANTRIWQLLNLVGFLFMLAMNLMANALPLFGRNTGEISAMYPNLFVPAGFTFAIWGLIYLLLLLFTVAQLRGFTGRGQGPPVFLGALGPWYFISGVANGLWLVAWHALQPFLSLLVMLVLLYSLIQCWKGMMTSGERKLSVRLAISVYLGWISVATVANATAVLVHYNWAAWGLAPELWTLVLVAVAILAGVWFLLKWSDVPYALVIIWALYGILSRTDSAQTGIYYLILAGIAILGITGVLRLPAWIKVR
jgi:hypothetical protein